MANKNESYLKLQELNKAGVETLVGIKKSVQQLQKIQEALTDVECEPPADLQADFSQSFMNSIGMNSRPNKTSSNSKLVGLSPSSSTLILNDDTMLDQLAGL